MLVHAVGSEADAVVDAVDRRVAVAEATRADVAGRRAEEGMASVARAVVDGIATVARVRGTAGIDWACA